MGPHLIALAALTWAQAPGTVSVSVDSATYETTYSISDGACRINWIIYTNPEKRHVIHHHSDCALPPADQMRLVSRLIDKVFADALAGSIRALSWGRLHPDGKSDPTLAMRLALAAKRSPAWDPARGVPKTGNVNLFVQRLANEAMIYPELRDTFRKAGMNIVATSAEMVLVPSARQLPFVDRLPKDEIRPADKLPYDCALWFSISPAGR